MKKEEIKDKRIALLLSGGVDSAVVLHELVSQGVKPDCFYIKIGPTDSPTPNPSPVGRGMRPTPLPLPKGNKPHPLPLSLRRGGI